METLNLMIPHIIALAIVCQDQGFGRPTPSPMNRSKEEDGGQGVATPLCKGTSKSGLWAVYIFQRATFIS